MAPSVRRLPPELVRRICDYLLGIKEWAADTTSSTAETQFDSDTDSDSQSDPDPDSHSRSNWDLDVLDSRSDSDSDWWEEEATTPASRVVDFIGLRTLPSLAVASRCFLEPALDALWDTLPSYGVLVYILPRDAWTVETAASYSDRVPSFRYISITRALTEDEVERVGYYTPRVRRIQELCPLFPARLQDGYAVCEPSVLAAFAPQWSAEKPLFPNLRILDLSPSNDQYRVYYRLFHVLFTPRLRRISNDYTAFSPLTKTVLPADYEQMLVRLRETAPRLLHLHLTADSPPFSSIIISAMSIAIRSFRHLVGVRTGWLPITEEAFRHLGELPHLEAIHVALHDTMTRDSFRLASDDEIFPSLRELRLLHDRDLALISLIVQHIHSQRLEIIDARLFDEDLFIPLDEVMPFFSAVLSRSNTERIKELRIAATIKPTPKGSFSGFSEQHIEPLFALRSLITLKLHLRCMFNLDDTALGRVARAWPKIRVLELGLEPKDEPKEQHEDEDEDEDEDEPEDEPAYTYKWAATLAALVPFARHRPELETLGFTLYADPSHRGLPSTLHLSSLGIPVRSFQRKLKVLKVGNAPIKHPRRIAAFLLDLFPNLETVEHGITPPEGPLDDPEWGIESEWIRYWENVDRKHIPALARAHGIVHELTLDDFDAKVRKGWNIGRRERR